MNENQDKPKIHFTFEISVVPTILAIVGIVFSIWQFIYVVNQNKLYNSSSLGIRVDQFFDNKTTISYDEDHFDRYSYRKKVKITLSNNGSKRASIVDWKFRVPIDVELEGERKTLEMWVRDIKPGMKNLMGESINLPLDIESGGSIAFIVEYSIGIPIEAYDLLSSELKDNKAVSWNSIETDLMRIYGKERHNEYLIEFLKSNGQPIAFRFSNFGTNGFMLGEKTDDMGEYVR